ncbi:Uncharacterized protein HDU87_006597 [Geranomyces variabilis]|uniref:Stage III sporulation protein AA AAA+ ATPase domain-containing protein n=1 Tax=Geranomyces variabilis TaxID=109894 RepID=A0AAD5XNU7_9FUNG|nr:Uncharacterized protein HDU87_006597 [Geranomyces variabilis]
MGEQQPAVRDPPLKVLQPKPWHLPFRVPIVMQPVDWSNIRDMLGRDLWQRDPAEWVAYQERLAEETDPWFNVVAESVGGDFDLVDELSLRAGYAARTWSFGGSTLAPTRFGGLLSVKDTTGFARGLTFDSLNRAAFPGNLHRVSRMRTADKKGVRGLTIRIGRVFSGITCVFDDILKAGRPSTRKTTLLRDVIRRTTDLEPARKVVVINRNDELAGADDEPHYCVGRLATIVRCAGGLNPADMISMAVRNQLPRMIVIDELSTKKEVEAALIAKRGGTALIASIHGDLHEFVVNKALAGAAGNPIKATVTDEVARSGDAGFEKTQTARTESVAFDAMIQIVAPSHWIVFHDLEYAVDAKLNLSSIRVEHRKIDDQGVLVHWFETLSFAKTVNLALVNWSLRHHQFVNRSPVGYLVHLARALVRATGSPMTGANMLELAWWVLVQLLEMVGGLDAPHCMYCGVEMNVGAECGDPRPMMTKERVVPTLSYANLSNLRVVCIVCNYFKRTLSLEALRNFFEEEESESRAPLGDLESAAAKFTGLSAAAVITLSDAAAGNSATQTGSVAVVPRRTVMLKLLRSVQRFAVRGILLVTPIRRPVGQGILSQLVCRADGRNGFCRALPLSERIGLRYCQSPQGLLCLGVAEVLQVVI